VLFVKYVDGTGTATTRNVYGTYDSSAQTFTANDNVDNVDVDYIIDTQAQTGTVTTGGVPLDIFLTDYEEEIIGQLAIQYSDSPDSPIVVVAHRLRGVGHENYYVFDATLAAGTFTIQSDIIDGSNMTMSIDSNGSATITRAADAASSTTDSLTTEYTLTATSANLTPFSYELGNVINFRYVLTDPAAP